MTKKDTTKDTTKDAPKDSAKGAVSPSVKKKKSATKKDIVLAIAKKSTLSQIQIKTIVEWTFDAIVDSLVKDRRIELRKFGVFEVKTREPRLARNPKTREAVKVEARNVVTFQAGKEMEEKIRLLELKPQRKRKKPEPGAANKSTETPTAKPKPAPKKVPKAKAKPASPPPSAATGGEEEE